MARLTHHIFLFVLVFAALALGVAGQWSKTLLEALCLFLLLLHLLNTRSGKSPFYPVPGLLPLILFTGYVLIQLTPLPPAILRLISPKTWDVYVETIWVIRPDIWMPLSVAPKSTLAEFFRFVSYGAFYLMTVQVCAEWDRLKKTTSFFAVFAGLFSVGGMLFFVLSKGRLFWPLGEWAFDASPYLPTDTNKNHYAGLMAMIFPLVLAQFLAVRPQVSYTPLRDKVVEIIRSPGTHPHILLGFSLPLVAAPLVLSLSRGGILSSLGALLLFSLLLLACGSVQKKGVPFALFIVTTLSAVVLFGWGTILDRFDRTGPDYVRGAEARQLIWDDSLKLIGDFPLVGTGFGTFSDAYPRYQTTQTGTPVVRHAGSGYLDLMAEGGLAGTLLLAWFLLSVLHCSCSGWRRRRNRTSVYLCFGSLSGLVAILLLSFADSPFHIGAIGLYLFFFLGLAVASATTPSQGKRRHVERIRVSPRYLRWAGIPVILLLSINLTFNAGILVGGGGAGGLAGFGRVGTTAAEGELVVQGVARQAVRFDPLEPGYHYALADSSLASGDLPVALEQFGAALRLSPLNADYLQRLGLVFEAIGEGGKAEILLQAGVENDRSDPEHHKVFAFWLLSRGDVKKALEHMRQAILLVGPQGTWDFLSLMALHGLSDEEMRQALPEQSIPLLAYGDYLLAAGKEKTAEESYHAAIRNTIMEKQPSPAPFRQLAEFYSDRGRYNEALEVIQAGIEIFPDDVDFRISAAGLYERLGVTYRAIEEYRSSLMLDPSNKSARKSLRQLVGFGHE